MDLMDLLKVGATLIQGNKDDATTGLDMGTIATALGGLMSNSNAETPAATASSTAGGLDLSSIVGMLANNPSVASGLTGVIASWIGNGANQAITPDQAGELVGTDKLNQFAQTLGLSPESAKGALADALPQMVDQATNADSSLASTLLEQVGGVSGALSMFGKLMDKA